MTDDPLLTSRRAVLHSSHPFNAEPALDRLRASLRTASADFYVRSHGDIPRLDPQSFRLQVGGLVAIPLSLSLADLEARFPACRVVAALQCAGNRRADLLAVRPVKGDPWQGGAIGNAQWGGVRLADLLRAAGLDEAPEAQGSLHVAFSCADRCRTDGEDYKFEVSIPLRKALAPEVLLATTMNGAPLAREHGAPLRALVPGFAGVRSAKWLTAITVQAGPSQSHPQARDYKLLPADTDPDAPDWPRGLTIDEMPLNALICEPAPFARLPPGPATLRGWAMASGRPVARVDVSADGGLSWSQAELTHDEHAPWSWSFWQAELPLGPGRHELVVRAWDSAGQTQPERADTVWNFKGYLSAAWHRVQVEVA